MHIFDTKSGEFVCSQFNCNDYHNAVECAGQAKKDIVVVRGSEGVAVGKCVRSVSGGVVTCVTALDNPYLPASGVITKEIGDGAFIMQIVGPCILPDITLVPGKTYVVGTSGELAALPLTTDPGDKVFVQKIGTAITSDSILLSLTSDVTSYVSD